MMSCLGLRYFVMSDLKNGMACCYLCEVKWMMDGIVVDGFAFV